MGQSHVTSWGEQYMAGTKRRAFLPEPAEMRRRYGDNAALAASIMGSLRPAVYLVFAGMAIFFVVVVILAHSSASAFPAWAVALLALDVVGACIALTVVTMRKAKRVAPLLTKRP
jgi:hypothetical protein